MTTTAAITSWATSTFDLYKLDTCARRKCPAREQTEPVDCPTCGARYCSAECRKADFIEEHCRTCLLSSSAELARAFVLLALNHDRATVMAATRLKDEALDMVARVANSDLVSLAEQCVGEAMDYFRADLGSMQAHAQSLVAKGYTPKPADVSISPTVGGNSVAGAFAAIIAHAYACVTDTSAQFFLLMATLLKKLLLDKQGFFVVSGQRYWAPTLTTGDARKPVQFVIGAECAPLAMYDRDRRSGCYNALYWLVLMRRDGKGHPGSEQQVLVWAHRDFTLVLGTLQGVYHLTDCVLDRRPAALSPDETRRFLAHVETLTDDAADARSRTDAYASFAALTDVERRELPPMPLLSCITVRAALR